MKKVTFTTKFICKNCPSVGCSIEIETVDSHARVDEMTNACPYFGSGWVANWQLDEEADDE